MPYDLAWARKTLDSLTALLEPEALELRDLGVADHTVAALYPVRPLDYHGLMMDLLPTWKDLSEMMQRFGTTDNYGWPFPEEDRIPLAVQNAMHEIASMGLEWHRPSAPYAFIVFPRTLEQMLLNPERLDKLPPEYVSEQIACYQSVCRVIDKALAQRVSATVVN